MTFNHPLEGVKQRLNIRYESELKTNSILWTIDCRLYPSKNEIGYLQSIRLFTCIFSYPHEFTIVRNKMWRIYAPKQNKCNLIESQLEVFGRPQKQNFFCPFSLVTRLYSISFIVLIDRFEMQLSFCCNMLGYTMNIQCH